MPQLGPSGQSDPRALALQERAFRPEPITQPIGLVGRLAALGVSQHLERKKVEEVEGARAQALQGAQQIAGALSSGDPDARVAALRGLPALMASPDPGIRSVGNKLFAQSQQAPPDPTRIVESGGGFFSVNDQTDTVKQVRERPPPEPTSQMRNALAAAGGDPERARQLLAQGFNRSTSVSQTTITGELGALKSIDNALASGQISQQEADAAKRVVIDKATTTPEQRQKRKLKVAREAALEQGLPAFQELQSTVDRMRAAFGDMDPTDLVEIMNTNENFRTSMANAAIALARVENPERVTDPDVELALKRMPSISTIARGNFQENLSTTLRSAGVDPGRVFKSKAQPQDISSVSEADLDSMSNDELEAFIRGGSR